MKKFLRILLAAALVITSVFVAAPVTQAAYSPEESAIIEDMISYYGHHKEKASTDIRRLLADLTAQNAKTGEVWGKIMDYWSYVNTEMPVNLNVAPDGLANDDSLCFVVLGFQLNPDGTMKDELIGRLQVALDSAKKYPNAYVACTGGGTASQNPSATEADQMAAWLIDNGVDPDRVIVENKSTSTVENAQFTYKILRESYPQIDSICMITSDYHIPRGCLLYNSRLLLSAYESGDKLLDIVSNAGYVTGSQGYESILLQAQGVCQIAGVSYSWISPELSVLESLTAENEDTCILGQEPNFKVLAHYNSGYTKDVTKDATIEGFDSSKEGVQNVTASYTENDVTKTVSFTVTVEKPIQSVDTDVLQYALELAAKADTNGVVVSVVEKFEALKAQAQDILNRAAAGDETLTQETVDQTWQDLINVMQYLSFKQGNKENLTKVIEMANSLDLSKYLDEGQDAFNEALTAAEAVNADGDAMQEDVDSAWKALLKAMSDLRLKPSKDALEALIASAQTVSLADVSETDAAMFRTALADAQAVYADAQATEEEVKTAVDTLAAAMDKVASAAEKEENKATNETISDLTANAASVTDTKDTAKDDSTKATSEKSVKTGDTANAATALVVMLGALAATSVILKKKKM